MKSRQLFSLIILLLISFSASAYIGPGAGIPILGSLFGLIATVVLVISAILFWPIRKLLKKRKQKNESDSES